MGLLALVNYAFMDLPDLGCRLTSLYSFWFRGFGRFGDPYPLALAGDFNKNPFSGSEIC